MLTYVLASYIASEQYLERGVVVCLYFGIYNPEPNMLKILPNIPSSTSQKLTRFPYFILISLPYCSLCFIVSGINIQRNMNFVHVLL